MREYRATDIRNVAVVGHGASGKTTLVDALSFVSGSSKRHGSIKEGTTLTDHTPEEIERGYSISLGCAYAEWMDTKINLIDTPGYLDFHGDAVAGIAAADGVICVVSAQSGVEVGTEKVFREAVSRGDPVLFAVSLMDKEHADFDRVYQQVKERLTNKVVPVEIPIGAGPGFRGVINLFTRRAYLYTPGSRSGEYTETEIPEDSRGAVERYHQELIEAISATDDAMLERYLEGVEIGRDEAIQGMKEAMKRMDLFPLFAVSAEHVIGIQAMLTELVQLMPSAFEMEEIHAFKGAEGDHTVEIHAVDTNPFSALVFKTVSEPHVGEVSYFRVFSGTVSNGQDVYNATRDGVEKMGHLCVAQGKERIEVSVLHAGDIGCVAKLKNTHTNDTLSTREHPVRLPQVGFPEPVVHFAVHAASRNDEEKLQQGLHRLHDEDPTFETSYNAETHETIIAGLGERHLDVSLAKLRRKYNVSAELTKPRIAYRETIVGRGEGQGRHKKQSGGRGQFGDCWIRMAPRPRGAGYAFVDKIVGGVIPSGFRPAVDKGIQEASARGILAGYPLVDFEVELFDGSYHSVDSNEMSFKMAGILGFRAVAPKCKPILLEPLDMVEITTPDSYLGDVMGNLSGRRGQILGSDSPEPGMTTVKALVPQAELHLYATDLSSLTHGHATYRRRFHGYEQMPADAAQRVVTEAAKSKKEEEEEA
ncbi:MAG TPA: elongation factor G [Gemmatimonadaceae bacterium]|nr:elongation factor G [Gemmatimonadaceae bacterium]